MTFISLSHLCNVTSDPSSSKTTWLPGLQLQTSHSPAKSLFFPFVYFLFSISLTSLIDSSAFSFAEWPSWQSILGIKWQQLQVLVSSHYQPYFNVLVLVMAVNGSQWYSKQKNKLKLRSTPCYGKWSAHILFRQTHRTAETNMAAPIMEMAGLVITECKHCKLRGGMKRSLYLGFLLTWSAADVAS